MKTHDEWIIGDGLDRTREYIVHTVAPRFTAEVFGPDDADGILGPLTYGGVEGDNYANFVFIDPAPVGEAFMELMRAMDAALIDHGIQAEGDLNRRDLPEGEEFDR